MSPCGIMDLSLASYKFSPLHRQSIIHYPPFLVLLPLVDTTCRLLPLVNYYDLAFGPTNSPPLESNTEKEDINSTREGQTL